MAKSTKLGKAAVFNIILFGFMGQVAWAVENNYFNTFLFNVIGGSSSDISHMVAASSVVAVAATLLMGTLSDKVNKRKVFICAGYIAWGFTVMAFAFISRENIGRILGIAPASALAATVSVVIIMDCLMTFMGSTSNDAAFNAWITDITDNSNRAKTEGMLATFPVLALVIVTVAFGILASSFGYPACFIGLGILVTVCGIIGLFTGPSLFNQLQHETLGEDDTVGQPDILHHVFREHGQILQDPAEACQHVVKQCCRIRGDDSFRTGMGNVTFMP